MLATGLVLAVIGLSMAMNFSFGYGLGSTELNARMLGGLSIACDGLKSLLPLFIAWQWADKHSLAASLAALLFLLLLAYGTASAIGFAAKNRTDATSHRDSLNATLQGVAADLIAAEARLAALPAHRLMGVIEADMASLRLDRLWQATKACTTATLQASRDFCQQLHRLRSELVIATEAAALTSKVHQLKRDLAGARVAGAGREADPQVSAMTLVIAFDTATLRSALAWLLALTIEAIIAFGLFAITPRRRHAQPATTPPPIVSPWRLSSKPLAPPTAWRLTRTG